MIRELRDLERYLRNTYGRGLSTFTPRNAPLGNDNLANLVVHLVKVVEAQDKKIEQLENLIRYNL